MKIKYHLTIMRHSNVLTHMLIIKEVQLYLVHNKFV